MRTREHKEQAGVVYWACRKAFVCLLLQGHFLKGFHTFGVFFPIVLILLSARLLLVSICLFYIGDGLARLVFTRRSLAFMSAWTLLVPYIRFGFSQDHGARPLYDIGKRRFGIWNRMGWVVFVRTDYWEDTIQLVTATGASAWGFGEAIGSPPLLAHDARYTNNTESYC